MKKIIRFALYSILIFTVLVGISASIYLGPYYTTVDHFRADSTAGYYSDFYLYVSPKAREYAESGHTITLLVQPNNSGTNSDDPSVHKRDAWWTGFERKPVADELGVVLLVPAFLRPAADWRIYTHALDRDVLTTERIDLARLDLQLLAMVEAAREELDAEGIKTDEQFLLQGFSASGMFANRFTVLHPHRVKAVAVGSPGGWPVAPLKEWQGAALPYPIGVADLQELSGAEFDSVAYSAVPQLIVLGSLDDNDSVDFRDGWDAEMAAIVDSLFGENPLSRWDHSKVLYQRAGAHAEFRLVDDVGHDRKALQHLSTQFFATILNR